MATVTPAYGRDYRSAREAKAAWYEGKDLQDAYGKLDIKVGATVH